jgi:hypothetical protein
MGLPDLQDSGRETQDAKPLVKQTKHFAIVSVGYSTMTIDRHCGLFLKSVHLPHRFQAGFRSQENGTAGHPLVSQLSIFPMALLMSVCPRGTHFKWVV